MPRGEYDRRIPFFRYSEKRTDRGCVLLFFPYIKREHGYMSMYIPVTLNLLCEFVMSVIYRISDTFRT